jgi:hypothetical protein
MRQQNSLLRDDRRTTQAQCTTTNPVAREDKGQQHHTTTHNVVRQGYSISQGEKEGERMLGWSRLKNTGLLVNRDVNDPSGHSNAYNDER